MHGVTSLTWMTMTKNKKKVESKMDSFDGVIIIGAGLVLCWVCLMAWSHFKDDTVIEYLEGGED